MCPMALGSWLLAVGSWLLALGSWLLGCLNAPTPKSPEPRAKSSYRQPRLLSDEHRCSGEEAGHVVCSSRPAEVIALRLVAFDPAKKCKLLGRLDTLGDHAEAKTARDPEHRRDDGHVALVVRKIIDERAIDLHRAERESLEVAER